METSVLVTEVSLHAVTEVSLHAVTEVSLHATHTARAFILVVRQGRARVAVGRGLDVFAGVVVRQGRARIASAPLGACGALAYAGHAVVGILRLVQRQVRQDLF